MFDEEHTCPGRPYVCVYSMPRHAMLSQVPKSSPAYLTDTMLHRPLLEYSPANLTPTAMVNSIVDTFQPLQYRLSLKSRPAPL